MVAILKQIDNSTGTSSQGFVAHNPAVEALLLPSYTIQHLQRIIAELTMHRTLSIYRFSNGAATAVTVTDQASLESALGNNLFNAWDRDSIFQAYGEWAATNDSEISGKLNIDPCAWRRGLIWTLQHHCNNQQLFTDIIEGKVPADGSHYPWVRVHPLTSEADASGWNHRQHDSFGLVLHFLFWQLNQNRLQWSDPTIRSLAEPFTALLFALFSKVEVWQAQDDSAWEFGNTAVHFSSIAIIVLALEELLQFVNTSGAINYLTYSVNAEGVSNMIAKCKETLAKLGSRESIWSDGERESDLAQLHPLLLQAISGRAVFSVDLITKILAQIESTLVGMHGVRRFAKDVWDGRVNALSIATGAEAQWTMGSPMISAIYGYLYRCTKDPYYLDKQQIFFSRTLAGIDRDYRLPEAYILSSSSEWIADANKPLAWAQAMAILSIASLKESLSVEPPL